MKVTKCPKCGEEKLTAAYEEHSDYTCTIDVHGDGEDGSYGDVEIDESTQHTYDVELIHIMCEGCNTYWYDTYEFARAVTKKGK